MKVSHNKAYGIPNLLLAVKELMYIINESKSQPVVLYPLITPSCERTNVHHK